MSSPVVVSLCNEPEGDVMRSIYPLQLTPENLHKIWTRARVFKSLFDSHINGDFRRFCEVFINQDSAGGLEANGLFWVVDDFVGLFYMNHIVPLRDAEVHYTFFDRRHKGRIQLARDMLHFVFSKYEFRRLSVSIPLCSSRHTFNFVESLGFRREGRRRKARWYNDDWFDVNLYGILKEEVLNGSHD